MKRNLFIPSRNPKKPMKTKPWAIALVIFFTFITSLGQILLKMASARLSANPLELLTNWPLILGGIVYLIAAALMLISFKGGELSVLYPIISLSYVWVSIAAPLVFPSESMNSLKWIGIVFIMGGVSFIGIGGTR